MKGLHKRSDAGAKGLESKEGERERLCSNNAGIRSPSLEFNPNSEFVSEDAALEYLAGILVEIYLAQENDGTDEEGGDLLPRFNEGAGR